MAYIQNVELSYDVWKDLEQSASYSGDTVYYLKTDLQYVPFFVDNSNYFVFYANVNRDPSSKNQLLAGTFSSAVIQDITYTATSYGAVKATGTVTVVDYTALAGAVLTVNGVALTEGAEWNAATSNAATASSLAGAITTATLTTLSTGAANGAVITITANTSGTSGNAITLVSSDPVNLTVSGATLTGGTSGVGGDDITITYVNDALATGREYVTVVGSAITVHIVSGASTAQQVVTAVTAWSAYNGNINRSQASAELVSAVVSGSTGHPQTTQGPTPLSGGVAPVTILADFTTIYLPTATLVRSFMDGLADDLI